MPIRSNRAYNDPNIGAAFENIASIFAPPSAQDTYAYAKAKAEREEAARAEEAYHQMTAEGAAPEQVDRFGVAIGRFNPTQSYRALEMGDATLRRDQDIQSGDRRYSADKTSLSALYGHDRTYQSSVENNVRDNARSMATNEADNARSLATNGADNARAIEERRMQEDGALARFFAAPVTVKQGERAYLPNQTAAATGLPAQLDGSEAPLTESQQLAQFIASMPHADQEQFVRDKYAPTETQVQGQERRNLRERGLLSDQELVDTINGQPSPVQAVGPDGKSPVFMSPGAAVREGARPFVNAGAAAKPELQNWIGPNGSGGGTATFDTTAGQWVDTSTGRRLPAGSRTYTGQLTGGSDATGLGPTVANTTSANNQEAEITRTLGTLDVYENLLSNNPGAIGLAGLVRGTAQNTVATMTDLVSSFGTAAPEINDAAADIKAGLSRIAPDVFDTSIPEAQFIQSTLAYALVRSENPSGEVSRQAYEDALRRVQGGGLLANSQSAKAAVSAQRQLLQNQLVGVRALRNPGQGRTDAGYRDPQAAPGAAPVSQTGPADAGAVERWERGPDGKMRKAQ